MSNDKTLGEALRQQGISRRGFLKFCAATASLMALPPSMVPVIAAALERARRPSVIWLSFKEYSPLKLLHKLIEQRFELRWINFLFK